MTGGIFCSFILSLDVQFLLSLNLYIERIKRGVYSSQTEREAKTGGLGLDGSGKHKSWLVMAWAGEKAWRVGTSSDGRASVTVTW